MIFSNPDLLSEGVKSSKEEYSTQLLMFSSKLLQIIHPFCKMVMNIHSTKNNRSMTQPYTLDTCTMYRGTFGLTTFFVIETND